MYEDKASEYFSFVRKDIAPLLPRFSSRVLEIGCGGGGTLDWLKRAGRAHWVAGIELCASAASVARTRLDVLYEGDADHHLGQVEPASLDLILCLDVLEHLVDPWATMARLQALLKPGGHLIISVPNVRHHSVVLPLLLSGRWQYKEAGIMDRTHLRFFSHESARTLLTQADLALVREKVTYAWGSYDGLKDKLSLGLLKDFLAFQYLICAQRPLVSEPQLMTQGSGAPSLTMNQAHP